MEILYMLKHMLKSLPEQGMLCSSLWAGECEILNHPSILSLQH